MSAKSKKLKGRAFMESGFVYAPYVPLVFTPVFLSHTIDGIKYYVNETMAMYEWDNTIILAINEEFASFTPKNAHFPIGKRVPSFKQGDLVKCKNPLHWRSELVSAYKLLNLDQFRSLVNHPAKFASVTRSVICELALPTIDYIPVSIEPDETGLYLGFLNIEEHGKLQVLHAVLLENSVYLVQNNSLSLQVGQRKIVTVK